LSFISTVERAPFFRAHSKSCAPVWFNPTLLALSMPAATDPQRRQDLSMRTVRRGRLIRARALSRRLPVAR